MFRDAPIIGGPPQSDEAILYNVNELLSKMGFIAPPITSMTKLIKDASSIFVLIFEKMFNKKYKNIIRDPQSKEDYAENLQTIINELKWTVAIDLSHIRGKEIVEGDKEKIGYLLNLLMRVCNYMQTSDLRGDQSLGKNTSKSDSITTEGSLVVTKSVQNLIDAKERQFYQQRRLLAAQLRRERVLQQRSQHSAHRNQLHQETSARASQQRWREECERDQTAAAVNRRSQEELMFQQVCRGVLNQQHNKQLEKKNQTREELARLRAQNSWHIQALQTAFDNQLSKLREQDEQHTRDDNFMILSKKRTLDEQRRSKAEEMRQLVEHRRGVMLQNRDLWALRRREAHHRTLALLAEEGWQDSLRSTASMSSSTFSGLRVPAGHLAAMEAAASEPGVGVGSRGLVRPPSPFRSSPFKVVGQRRRSPSPSPFRGVPVRSARPVRRSSEGSISISVLNAF